MYKTHKFAMATMVAMGLGMASSASALMIVDGADERSFGYIPGGETENDVLDGEIWQGYYGGALQGEAGWYEFTFIGYEAAFENTLSVDGESAFSTPGGANSKEGTVNSPIGETFTFEMTEDGLLPFSFISTNHQDSEDTEEVTNADNPNNNPWDVDETTGMDFFLTFEGRGGLIETPDGVIKASGGSMATEGELAYLFFDDFGAGVDDNHDDMVVTVQRVPAPVPEPGTLALLGAGLLGVGMAARRARRGYNV